jgi:hypothetical protein
MSLPIIKRRTEVAFELTVSEIAVAILDMNDDEQTELLNSLARESKGRLPFQLQAITDNKGLTSDARYLLSQLGDYAHPCT